MGDRCRKSNRRKQSNFTQVSPAKPAPEKFRKKLYVRQNRVYAVMLI